MPSRRSSCEFVAFKQSTIVLEINPGSHSYGEVSKANTERFNSRSVEPKPTLIEVDEAQQSANFIWKAHSKSPYLSTALSFDTQCLEGLFDPRWPSN